MCGICGFVSKKTISRNILIRMNNSMSHRGPDDYGIEYFEDNHYQVGLGHRRLSILDLSDKGHQPMWSEDRSVVVIFNGEIYNFKDLQEELGKNNFVSSSDTEVILAAYKKWGINCISRFNGMFAIALYDCDKKELFLIRDRIGKKPLYYSIKNDDILFASELKALMEYENFRPQINTDVLSRYLLKQYIQGEDTIFEDTYKLLPGHILTFRNGNYEVKQYWNIVNVYCTQLKNKINDYQIAKEGLKSVMQQAVKRRLVADVPVGVLLSGGYDSSLVTAMAQEATANGHKIKTFSIGFNNKYNNELVNEAPFAKIISNYLGTDHSELYCEESDMVRLIDSIPQYYDEPFADPSEIPTMLVSELARKNVTVVLSGDGGDEFFCGYNDYDILARLQKFGIPTYIIDILGMRKFEKIFPLVIREIARNFRNHTDVQFINVEYEEAVKRMVNCGTKICNVKFDSQKYNSIKNWQVKRMLLDMESYLPDDILTKVDRASMKYSLECRCPILDVEVMEYSFRINHKLKYNGKSKKAILKDIVHEYIPREIMERPKNGFGIPLDKWLKGVFKEQLQSYCDMEYLKNQGIFDPFNTNFFVNNYLSTEEKNVSDKWYKSNICWSFLIFQKWYDFYKKCKF